MDVCFDLMCAFGYVFLGEWDGVGAVVKSRLRQEQIQNSTRRLQNAEDVARFLEDSFSDRAATSYNKKKDPIF